MRTPGDAVLDDYVLEVLLGEGAMGAVWRVRDRLTGEALALKLARHPDGDARRQLLGELRVWGALPQHRHVVGLRFFRSIDDEVALFLDLVDGPSLDRRLGDGPPLDDAARVDIAIQVAWGLQGIHAHGVVHQDVKPANVLLGSDGVARVSDLGVAAARRADSSGSPLVTVAGMSRAWAAPEQLRGERVGPEADQWSWAALVLQLFVGALSWGDGRDAPLALAAQARRGARGAKVPRGVAEVLRRCFREEPKERFSSMDEVVARLVEVYGASRSEPYPRGAPALAPRAAEARPPSPSRFDPIFWASRLSRHGGCSLDVSPRSVDGTSRDRALDDLHAFERLSDALEHRVTKGRTAACEDLAMLWWAQSRLHGALGDLPGAGSTLARASALLERLIVAGRADLDIFAAQVRLDRALLRAEQGALSEALHESEGLVVEIDALLRRDLAIDERAVMERMRDGARVNHAALLVTRGDAREALSTLEPVFARIEGAALERDAALVEAWFARGLPGELGLRPGPVQGELALAWHNRGSALLLLGATDEAEEAIERAIELYESLPATPAWRRQQLRCVSCVVDLAMARGDPGAALGRLAGVERRLESERHDGAPGDLVAELAGALARKAVAELAVGDLDGCRSSWVVAEEAFARLVRGEGRREFVPDFARAALRLAHALERSGRHRESAETCDRPVAMLRALLGGRRGRELVTSLVELLTQRATSRSNAPEAASRLSALADFDLALALHGSLPDDMREALSLWRLTCALNRAWLALEIAPSPERVAAASAALEELGDASRRTGDPELVRILAAAEGELTSLLASSEGAYPPAP